MGLGWATGLLVPLFNTCLSLENVTYTVPVSRREFSTQELVIRHRYRCYLSSQEEPVAFKQPADPFVLRTFI